MRYKRNKDEERKRTVIEKTEKEYVDPTMHAFGLDTSTDDCIRYENAFWTAFARGNYTH